MFNVLAGETIDVTKYINDDNYLPIGKDTSRFLSAIKKTKIEDLSKSQKDDLLLIVKSKVDQNIVELEGMSD